MEETSAPLSPSPRAQARFWAVMQSMGVAGCCNNALYQEIKSLIFVNSDHRVYWRSPVFVSNMAHTQSQFLTTLDAEVFICPKNMGRLTPASEA